MSDLTPFKQYFSYIMAVSYPIPFPECNHQYYPNLCTQLETSLLETSGGVWVGEGLVVAFLSDRTRSAQVLAQNLYFYDVSLMQ